MNGSIWIEAAKLAAQILGGLLVARLAVNWALNRYKAEKLWERRLAAYSDVVTSVSDLRLILRRWIEEIEEQKNVSDEGQEDLRTRSKAARRQWQDSNAVAKLILPVETGDQLENFYNEFVNVPFQHDIYDMLGVQLSVINRTLEWTVREGRADLLR